MYTFDKTTVPGSLIIYKDAVRVNVFELSDIETSKEIGFLRLTCGYKTMAIKVAEVTGATSLDDIITAVEAGAYVQPATAIFIATVTQAGVGAPTISAKVKTFTGEAVTGNYVGVGSYTLTSAGVDFTKAVVSIEQNLDPTKDIRIAIVAGVITIKTFVAGVAANAVLSGQRIRIEINPA